MGKKFNLAAVKALAMANYDRGGDYPLEIMSDDELEMTFCVEGGKRKLYRYMQSVCEMRNELVCGTIMR